MHKIKTGSALSVELSLTFFSMKKTVNLFLMVRLLENDTTGLNSNRKDAILSTPDLMLQVAILLSNIVQGGLGYVYESYSNADYRADKLLLCQFSVFFRRVAVVRRMTNAFF